MRYRIESDSSGVSTSITSPGGVEFNHDHRRVAFGGDQPLSAELYLGPRIVPGVPTTNGDNLVEVGLFVGIPGSHPDELGEVAWASNSDVHRLFPDRTPNLDPPRLSVDELKLMHWEEGPKRLRMDLDTTPAGATTLAGITPIDSFTALRSLTTTNIDGGSVWLSFSPDMRMISGYATFRHTDPKFTPRLVGFTDRIELDFFGFLVDPADPVGLPGLSKPFGPDDIVLDNLGADGGGWRSQDAFPRLTGDIDGDGRADIVGFGSKSSFVTTAQADDSYAALAAAVQDFSHATGWRSNDSTPRLMGDINGDGLADIFGFGAARTLVSLSLGDGSFTEASGAIDNFSRAQGWASDDAFARRVGDVDGDGRGDIIGFGAARTFVASGRPDGSFGPLEPGLANFAKAQGWVSDDATPRLVGDINNDGFADIVGFGVAKTFSALGSADGSFAGFAAAVENFSRAQGWRSDDATPRLLADVDGDGNADIVGFGNTRTFVSLSRGDGSFDDARATTREFSRADGWTSLDEHPRAMADIDGDGAADILGFGADGLVTFSSDYFDL